MPPESSMEPRGECSRGLGGIKKHFLIGMSVSWNHKKRGKVASAGRG